MRRNEYVHMQVHSSSRECASQILSLIESVSLHYKCAQKMVDASLYETLLFIADAYADDPQIAFSLSSIMDNLCATPESSAALVQWGGLQIPLGIMEKQAHDVDFCGVQLDILHQRIASSDKAVEELRRLNALQPLSQVYERHTDNETLRASAMYIMNTLTDDTHSVATVVKSIRILTSQLGDPRCTANEFKVNQAIVSLSAAAETLKCLSVVDVNCDEILAADGIEALIYAYMTEPLRQMTDDDYRKVSIRTSIMVIAERCSVRLCSRSNDESAGAEQSPQALSGALKSVPVSDLFHVASSSHLSQPDTQLLSSALRSFGNLMKVSPQITAVHASAILNTVDPEVLTACLMANVDQPQGVILPLQEIIRLVMEKGTPISHAKVVSYVNTLLTCINKHIMERGVVLDAVNALVSCTRQSSEAMRALAQSPQFSSTMHAILSRYEEDATVCTPTLSLLNDALKIDPDLAGGLSAHLLNTLHNILQTHTEAPEVLRAAQSVMDMIKSELETEASPSSPSNHTVASASVQSAPPPTSPHAGVPSEVGILQSQLSVYRNDKSLHDLSLSPQLPSDREAPLSFTAMDIEAHVNNLNTISSDSLHNFYTLLTQEPEDPEYAVLAIEHGAAKKLTAFIETHIDPCDELFWDAMKALIALIERMDIRIIEAMIEGCETTQPELIRMLSVLFELDAARIIAPFRELYKRLVRDCVRLLSILVGMYPKVMLALQRQRIVPALMFLLQRVDDKRTSLYGRNIMHLLYQLTASPFVDATIKRTVLQAYETYDIPTFFRLIRGHTHDGRFVRYAAGFIANMAMIHPRIRNDLGVSGSIILLLDLLSQYQHDAFITDTVVHALVVMTEDHPVHTAFIIAAQREQTLLSCLHQYIGNKKIAHGILCVVLSVMNTNSPNLDALVENQGLASLLQCMWHHSSSEEFSLTCLDLIKSLLTRQYKKDRKSSTIEQQQLKTLYRTIKSEMIYRGFGRGIVASVTEHVSSSPVAYQALQAMVCLIKEADEEEFAILISEGAVFMLYSVIRHHLSADALNSTLAASAMNALLIALKYHTVATQAAVMKQVPFREMNTLVVTYVMDALRRAMAGVQEAEREKAVQDKARERLRVAAIVKVREEHREKERKEKEQRRQLLEREARTPAATAAKTAATTTTPIVKATEQQHSEGTESNDTSAAVSGEEEGTGVHIDLESHTTSLSISLSRLSSSSSSSSSSETYYQTMSVSRSSSVYSRRSSIEPSTSDADTPQATSSLQRQGRTPEEEKKIEKEVAEKPDVIVPELSTLYNSLIVRVWLRFLCIIARNTSNTEHLLNEDVENQVLMTLQKHYLAGASRIAEECLELLEILSDHSHDSPSHLMIKSSLLCIHLYSTTKYLNPSMLGQLNSALASLCRDRRSAHLMALTVMLSNAFLLVAYEDDDCVCVPSLQLLANLFNFKFPTLSLQYTPVVANLFQYLCNRAKHVNSSSSDNSSNSNSNSSYSSYSMSSSSRDGLTPVVFGLRVIQNLLLANGSMMKPYLETQHSLHKHLSTIENGFLISPPSHLQQVRRLIASIKEICKQIARTKRISSSNTDRSSTMPRANASTRLFRRDDSSTSADMPSDVRNLLLAGAELWKHSSHVSKRLRHVRITPDLRYLVWKDRKVKAHAHSVTMKQKMKVFQIKAVEVGRKTEPLLRRSSLTRKHSARRDCAFAVVGEERTLSLEAHSTQEREQWVHALNTLVRHVQARRKAAKSPLLTKRHYTVE